MSIKIAFIGAGSLGFTRRLVADLLAVPELSDARLAFMDIDRRHLDMVTEIVRRDIAHNGAAAELTATTDRVVAIRDADYVVVTIRHGGLEAFRADVEIPLKYGIDQCVGDTLCAGGLTYAQRHIPVLLDIAREIEEHARPGCLLMNYANPMAMNTWAVHKYTGVRAVGLCHGVQHGFTQICNALGIPKEETDYICAGINHQTWYLEVRHKGRDMLPRLLAAMEKHPDFSRSEKVRIDVLRRFGFYSTESNGHLSEYLPWYRRTPKDVRRWIDLGSWINGETGGYLRICTEGRDWFKKEFPKILAEPSLEFDPAKRTEEHFSHIIEAEQTGRIYRGHFNVANDGFITNLQAGCVIEVPGFVDRFGIHPQHIGDLPLACAAVIRHSVSVQELGMEAAVHGDPTLFKQALLLDPLTAAVCDTEEVWQLGDELLVATAKWLPQYSRQGINAAKKRLQENPPSYRKATRGIRTKGSASGDMFEILESSGTGTKRHRATAAVGKPMGHGRKK